jgi:Uma2 family endonuclease
MSIVTEPQVHLWNRHEYHQMADMGLFAGKRVELIEGQVISMSPMGSLHATAIALVAQALEAVFQTGYYIRWQMPFVVGMSSEPEPDIAVVPGTARDYRSEHPTVATLIIEVADTSLAYDRDTKGAIYAKAGVLDYWILNVVERHIEVYRKPIVDPAHALGYSYGSREVFRDGDMIEPLEKPGQSMAVADMLP